MTVNIIGREERKVQGNFTQLFSKDPRPEDKGTPSPDPTITAADIIEDMKFERVCEIVNIYDVPEIKQLLVCRPYLVRLTKPQKFDAKGDRVYQYDTSLSLGAIPYPPPPSPASEGQKKLGEVT